MIVVSSYILQHLGCVITSFDNSAENEFSFFHMNFFFSFSSSCSSFPHPPPDALLFLLLLLLLPLHLPLLSTTTSSFPLIICRNTTLHHTILHEIISTSWLEVVFPTIFVNTYLLSALLIFGIVFHMKLSLLVTAGIQI